MPISFVVNSGYASGQFGGTTSAVDTTGANLLVAYVSSAEPEIQVTDSKGNTWTGLSSPTNVNSSAIGRIFYSANPLCGSGHTFTVATTHFPSIYATISISAFAGCRTLLPVDLEGSANNYNVSGLTTVTTPSITPDLDNCLIFTGCFGHTTGNTATLSVDSSISITEQHTVLYTARYDCVGNGYIIQTSATAVQPTWTFVDGIHTTTPIGFANIAAFKPASPVVLAGTIPSASGVTGTRITKTVPLTAKIGSQTKFAFGNFFFTRVGSESTVRGTLSKVTPGGLSIYDVNIKSLAPTAYLKSNPTNPTASLKSNNDIVGITYESVKRSPGNS